MDEEDEFNGHHPTDDSNGDDNGNPSIDDDDDNDNGGGNYGVVPIPIEVVHAVRDAIQQPSKTGIAGNDDSETREVGQEDDVPIGQLFPTPLLRSTP